MYREENWLFGESCRRCCFAAVGTAKLGADIKANNMQLGCYHNGNARMQKRESGTGNVEADLRK